MIIKEGKKGKEVGIYLMKNIGGGIINESKSKLSNYEIGKELGKGNFGTVKLCIEKNTKRIR